MHMQNQEFNNKKETPQRTNRHLRAKDDNDYKEKFNRELQEQAQLSFRKNQ